MLKEKAIAIVVLGLFAGLAPLTATVLFCANAPCCIANADPGVSLSRSGPDCCSPVSCFEAPAQNLPKENALKAPPSITALILDATYSTATQGRSIPDVATVSPPRTTGRRLSVLSTLLI